MTPIQMRAEIRQSCRVVRRLIQIPRMLDPMVVNMVEQIEAEAEDALGFPVNPMRRFLPHTDWQIS